MNLADRVTKLGERFDEIYHGQYPQLSWYVHSGVTGVAYGNSQLFVDLTGVAFQITYNSYVQILEAVMDEFQLHKADQTLRTKFTFTKFVAFAETQEQAKELLAACSKD
jgi:hypothetical protein